LLPQSNGAPLERISIQAQCTGSITSVTSSTFRSLLRPKDQRDYWEQLALMDVNLMKESSDAINGYKDFVAVGLTPGNVYYFRARALNRNGWSPDGEISDGICTNGKLYHKPQNLWMCYVTDNLC
jgi:hypothetical protein